MKKQIHPLALPLIGAAFFNNGKEFRPRRDKFDYSSSIASQMAKDGAPDEVESILRFYPNQTYIQHCLYGPSSLPCY